MDYMARALQLATRALGRCSPNPAVGAVLVRDGEVVGEGATQPAGQAHAEVVALQAAGERARGSTLYVTLEPCAHFGRTPPCADALVEAGIVKAHVAMLDPSPWVDGGGNAVLERAGIPVVVGVHGHEARQLNEAYLTWLQRGRPLVTGIYALGLDGSPQPLTKDRLGDQASGELALIRARAARTVTDPLALLADDADLSAVAADGVTSLHVEAGPGALSGLAEQGLLDRLIVFLTPSFGAGGGDPFGGVSTTAATNLGALTAVTAERLGDTVLITGYPSASGSALLTGTTP